MQAHPTLRCSRCSSDLPIVASVEYLSDPRSFAMLLCEACDADVTDVLFNNDEAVLYLIDPEIDVAEHHALCHCPECDPDAARELRIEAEYDAERHVA
jgi:hypothetical protein